jgi:hypothetical protein
MQEIRRAVRRLSEVVDQLCCDLPSCEMAIELRNHDAFGFLKDKKRADGALLLVRNGEVEAHVVECKKTMDSSAWAGVRHQWRATIYRLMALAGAIGERVARAVVYSAYRHDRLSAMENPDPIDLKNPLGEEPIVEASWECDQVWLEGFAAAMPHVKVPLDPKTGVGHVALCGR